MAQHTQDSYAADVDKLTQYLQIQDKQIGPADVTFQDVQSFIHWIANMGLSERSQARIISGIKSFYTYCLQEGISTSNPTLLLQGNKSGYGERLTDNISPIFPTCGNVM